MNNGSRVGCYVVAMICLGASPLLAQAPGQVRMAVTYECAANAHCNVSCSVDGEKEFQTGSPKTVTVTLLAPNNYLVDLAEQNGNIQSMYLAGTKVICNFDGVARKGGE